MYFVLATLRASPGSAVPDGLVTSLSSWATAEDRLQHLVAHVTGPRTVALGLFLVAPRLAEAERTAAVLCRRAIQADPALRNLELIDCQSPLIGRFYERMLDVPRPGWTE
ncbi:hypothetical protein [Kitasatospora sp. MAP5-34]|uniref:hypothetical protein n=1 Tax=Kitasatospora sp. MAP5-34 TaxID=3035102 RepID=UPI002472F239|nr:hypothetical protein [Kitasatospora sp. MAP5-34]MDH6578823.1 hypothetical protein [Kitasatospora sp. MAP5-34]